MLTDRQQEVLDFIIAFLDDNGFQPTVREMMVQFDMHSPNGPMSVIKALEAKGVLCRSGSRARALSLSEDKFQKTIWGLFPVGH